MIYIYLRKASIFLFSYLYRLYLLMIGVNVGKRVIFLGLISIRGNPRFIHIGDNCKIQTNVCFNIIKNNEEYGEIRLGDNVLIGDRTIISAAKGIEIKAKTEIAANCYIIDHDHDSEFTTKLPKPVVIEEGVWVGCGAVILKGVLIKKNSVVGAGSLLTKTYEKSALIVGSPARIIKESKNG